MCLRTFRCSFVAAMFAWVVAARAAAPWYNSGSWSYRLAITISHTKISGPLTNFPVLINLTNSSLQQYAQTNGNDLLFTAGDGTNKLAHEIESYTNSTGTLVAWVKVPLLTSTADTNIYLYYGNAAAASQQNAGGVWDANYKGVWHLNQTPTGSAGDIADSTTNNNDGTSQTIAAGAQVAGKIGGSLTLDGTSDYISTTTSFVNPQTLTLEAWVKTTGNGKKVVGFENTQTGTGSTDVDREIYFGVNGNVYFGTFNPNTSATEVAVSTNTLNNGQWHLLVGYRDNAASVIGLYVDGVLQATNSSSAIQSYTGWYRIGAYKSTSWPSLVADGYFPGSVDEIKISHSVRSAAWIATEYNNQSSPATFYSLGSQESLPATKLAITTVNGGSNPAAGAGFSVVVQSQDANGNAANVVSNTAVSVSLNTGSGTLGGTLTGTIPAGTNSVTITGVTYTKAESGVILTATRTSGDTLTAGNSSSFTVNAGAVLAGQSTISASPGAVAADNHTTSTITVTLNDAYGNPVSGKIVTLAKSGGSSTISVASGSSGASGVVTFTVLDAVAETTTYTATDSTDSITITQTTSVTFTSLPWNNTGWRYRMMIQINSNQVSGPLTNFPVLVNLTNNSLSQYAQTNGNDLLFTAGDGTNKLAHEIERYTSSNGLLVAWVNVPLLPAAANTNIYLYYGNATATNQQNAGGVWDANFKGVWHLQQTPTGSAGDMADSTTNNNAGTSQTIAAGAQVAGKIGGSLTLDGTSDYISTATQFTGPSNITVQVWAKTTSTAGNKVICFESAQTGTSAATYDRHIYVGTDGKARFGVWNAVANSTNMVVSANAVNDGQWHFLVGCRDNAASTVSLYVDGVLQGTAASSAGQTYTGWYRIGSYTMYAPIWQFSASGYFNGSVDEARVSHIARSAAWIATEYKNQSSPATFYNLCNPESQPPTKLAITSVNGGSNATYGTSFSVVVQAQDANGNAANVVTNTAVTLSLNTGSGTLGGMLTGTITNGTSSLIFSGITYSKAQSGIILTATRSSGDSLTAGNSSAFTMNPATVTIASGLSANNKTYDGTTSATISSNNVSLSGVIAGDSANVKLSTNGYTATFASAAVGNGIGVTVSGLTLTGNAATNYTLNQPSLTANISAATVTVASGLSANNKTYDGTTAATISSNNVSLSGVIAGDSANVKLSTNGYTATFAGAAAGSGIGVTVGGLTLTGSAAGNYTLTPPNLSANITAKGLTVAGVTASNKVYDGTTNATVSTNGATLVGVVGGDTVTLAGTAIGSFATKTVASGKTVTVSGLTLGGASAGNYTLTQPTTNANITAATLTVTGVTANNKVYDGTTTATVNTGSAVLVGVIGGDTVTLNTGSATGTFSSASVGLGKTVTLSGLTLGGADAANYSLTQPTTTANIYAAIVIGGASGSQNWSAITNGSGPGGQPSAGDSITVYTGATLTVDVTNAVCASIGLGTVNSMGPGFLVFNSGSQVTVSGGVTLGVSGGSAGTFGQLTMTSGGTMICQSLAAYNPSGGGSSVWIPGTGMVQFTSNNTLPNNIVTNFNKLVLSAGTTSLGTALTVTNLKQSGGNLALGANALTVVNSHYAGTNTVSGTGAYTNISGLFETASPSGVAGNLPTSGAISLAGTFLFDGAAAQVTSATMPANISGITISNAAGVTLSQTTTTTNLTLASGNLTTAPYQLNVANTSNSAISGGGSASYVVGALQKAFGSGTNQAFTFPIGTATGYTPIAISNLNVGGSGFRAIAFQSTDGEQPQLGSSGITTNQSVNRYWTLTQSGSTFTNCTITFNYLASDLDAAAYPSDFIAQIYTNSVWSSVTVMGTPTSTSTVVTNYSGGSALFVIGNPISNQAITFDSPGNQTYGVGPIALTATASSGLTVTYSVSGPATVTDNILYITGAGTVSIVASQLGNGVYGPATPVEHDILVSPKTLTVASGITANNKTYDGVTMATISSNNVSLSGVVAGDSANVKLSTNGYTAAFASATVGNGIGVTVSGLTLTGSAATNYTLTQPGLSANITAAPLTVTANNTNRAYGAANPSFSASYSGFVNGETASLVQGAPGFSTTATISSPVNSYSITPSVGSLTAPNYSFTTFNNGTLTVTQASSTNVVTTSANPSPTGSNVTFTASLTAVSPGSGTPTGNVQFMSDGTALGVPAALSGGVASLTVNSLAHGTHVITANYAGDGNFIGNTNTLNQIINTAPVAASETLWRYPTTGVKTRVTTLLASDSDPDGDAVSFVSVAATSAQNGTVATNSGWIFYTPPAGYTNTDSFSYVITDGGLQATGAVAMAMVTDTNATQNVELSQDLGNGSFVTSFFGIPGRAYSIQYTTNLTNPDWQTLGTAAADATGWFQYTDSPGTGAPARFYRSTYP